MDGHIARSTNQVTNFGKLMDPVADKLLLIAALVPVVEMGRASGWVVAVIICCEFAVSGLRILNSHQGIIIPASNLSKYKMAVMITSIILLILNYHIFFISFQFLGTVILWMVLTLSIISGIDCFIKSWSVIDIET
jgi:CDP-diacylglycerol--glycerol-3-phosphate 3-phosphatidyltransferase